MKTLRSRLMEKVKKNVNGCWVWGGGETVRGGGTSHRPRKLAWEVFKGEVPPGMNVIGVCGLLKCISPEDGHSALSTSKFVFKKQEEAVVAPVPPTPVPPEITFEQAQEMRKKYNDLSYKKGLAGFEREYGIPLSVVEDILEFKIFPLTNNPS